MQGTNRGGEQQHCVQLMHIAKTGGAQHGGGHAQYILQRHQPGEQQKIVAQAGCRSAPRSPNKDVASTVRNVTVASSRWKNCTVALLARNSARTGAARTGRGAPVPVHGGKAVEMVMALEVATSAPKPMVSQTRTALARAQARSRTAPSPAGLRPLYCQPGPDQNRAKISMAEARCGPAQSGGGMMMPGSSPVRTMYQPNTACAPPARKMASSRRYQQPPRQPALPGKHRERDEKHQRHQPAPIAVPEHRPEQRRERLERHTGCARNCAVCW